MNFNHGRLVAVARASSHSYLQSATSFRGSPCQIQTRLKIHRRWLVVEFAHSGCQPLEMDLFGNASSAEISLSSFHPQGCFSSFHIISLKSFQRLREGASSWLDEYRRLVDETPTVVGSVLHGHTDEVG